MNLTFHVIFFSVLCTCGLCITLDRKTCHEGVPAPPTRINTSERVSRLRQQLRLNGINVYIIPGTDQFLNLLIGPESARRQWLSGFTGYTGDAVVTLDHAVIATDSRYTVRADLELDCQWQIVQVPYESLMSFIERWYKSQTNVSIGVDPKLMSGDTYARWLDYSKKNNFRFTGIEDNLIDKIWIDKPEAKSNPIFIHGLEYAGETWQSKISKVRQKMTKKNINALLVSQLDEIAWLFNLRGSDILYSPVFYSYAIIELNRSHLYIFDTDQSLQIQRHLGQNNAGNCAGKNECVYLKDYKSNFANDLKSVSGGDGIKFWASQSHTNYHVLKMIKQISVSDSTPIRDLKAVKNRNESLSFEKCLMVDSAAYVEFISILEKEMMEGEQWSELKALQMLEVVRGTYPNYHGPSFPTISSSGPNAATIHYAPSKFSDRQLSLQETYLLDAGSQFPGCTTDITRTFFFGKPSAKIIEAYTRVLMGFIDVANSVWPDYAENSRLEAAARRHLWKKGLEYKHGTGHGIGTFLYVHEYPNGLFVDSTYVLKEGNFQSCEPGYYEPNQFGIRLETILGVKIADTKYKSNDTQFYSFYPVSLVPFERKLINVTLLNRDHIEWLNRYHSQCLQRTGSILEGRKQYQALKWLKQRTSLITQRRTSVQEK